MIKQYARITLSNLNMAYRKTGTRDPSGILSGPYKNRKTGTLQKPENRDPSGTLRKPESQDPSGTLRMPENRDSSEP